MSYRGRMLQKRTWHQNTLDIAYISSLATYSLLHHHQHLHVVPEVWRAACMSQDQKMEKEPVRSHRLARESQRVDVISPFSLSRSEKSWPSGAHLWFSAQFLGFGKTAGSQCCQWPRSLSSHCLWFLPSPLIRGHQEITSLQCFGSVKSSKRMPHYY